MLRDGRGRLRARWRERQRQREAERAAQGGHRAAQCTRPTHATQGTRAATVDKHAAHTAQTVRLEMFIKILSALYDSAFKLFHDVVIIFPSIFSPSRGKKNKYWPGIIITMNTNRVILKQFNK